MSAICGGVINLSKFNEDPMRYMMCYVLPDKEFKMYLKANDEERIKIFNKFAHSAI